MFAINVPTTEKNIQSVHQVLKTIFPTYVCTNIYKEYTINAPSEVRMYKHIKRIPQDLKIVHQDLKIVPHDLKIVPQDLKIVPQDLKIVPQNSTSRFKNNISRFKKVPQDLK